MNSAKNQKTQYFFIILAAISVLLLISNFYIGSLKGLLIKQLKENLSEIAYQTSVSIREKIRNDEDTIIGISTMLEEHPYTHQEMVDHLKTVCGQIGFKRMGIISPDGNAITTDGYSYDFSDREYFKKALAGETAISQKLTDKVDGKEINVYATPVYQNNTVAYVLFATRSSGILSDILFTTAFAGEGFSSIADSNGNIILITPHKNSDPSLKSISQLTFEDEFQFTNMSTEQSGVVEFLSTAGEQRYMAYVPLQINDWFALSVVPKSVVSHQITNFVRIEILSWTTISAAFILILLYIFSTQKKNKSILEHLAFYDNVTEYHNFNQFQIDAVNALHNMTVPASCIVSFDIKKFKMFNDVYGYHAGDQVLKCIMDCCRALIQKDELCSRETSDQFILLLKESNKKIIANRLNELYRNIKDIPYVKENKYNFDLCFGVFIVTSYTANFNNCYDKAKYAKNQIKDRFDTNICFFSEDMYRETMRKKSLESKMETALKNGEFTFYLQPKIDLQTGKLAGAEALVRWIDEKDNVIMPMDFIPIFEENGFIEKLDMYLIDRVCKKIKEWISSGKDPIVISVNISKVYIFKNGFAEHLRDIVASNGIDSKYIELEITESIVFYETDELIGIINTLKSYGFTISMDDFGSGFSSLNMLKDMPIDIIKLDRIFFESKTITDKANVVIKSILSMSKMLHIQTVAEGIEYQEQADFLTAEGCSLGQGYYFSRPIPISEFEKLL